MYFQDGNTELDMQLTMYTVYTVMYIIGFVLSFFTDARKEVLLKYKVGNKHVRACAQNKNIHDYFNVLLE